MKNIIIPIFSVFILGSLLLSGCGKVSSYSDDITTVLEKAGDNRGELEKVLQHYANDPDTLKLKSAEYLIANMEGHCYATYYLHDTTGAEIEFDVLSYPDYDQLVKAADSIEKIRGEIDYEKKELIYDIDIIKADYLINQIDYAFKAWREKPWARQFSFDQFCAYILPYRGSNEPLEDWRQPLWDKYADIASKVADSTDPISAAKRINSDITSWFKFDPRYYYHPTDQGLSEMMTNKLGRCEDMTNITIYAFRANGLAVTSDYTPFWANSGNNHAWNAIVYPDGRVVPFMGAERNPGDYKLANKLAKVYRKSYAQNKSNLYFQDRKQEKMPGWLAGKSYLDVTPAYTEVSDVIIDFTKEIPDSVNTAYLCVFNSGEWQAVHWGKIQNGKALFNDMGTGIAYLPALYLNEKIVPFGAPFILHENKAVSELTPSEQKQTMQLLSTTKRQLVISTDGIAQTYLTPEKEYELFIWNNDQWTSLGTGKAGKTPLYFDAVPQNALYWLVEKDSDREERIFTYIDGVQIWW